MGLTSRKAVHTQDRPHLDLLRKGNILQVPADRPSSSIAHPLPSNSSTTNIKTNTATVMTNMEMGTTKDTVDNMTT